MLCTLVAATAAAQQPPAGPSEARPLVGPPAPPASRPTTTGSFEPDVYLDDITYTLRSVDFRTIAVSPHDPNLAFVGSYNGFLFRTRDGGRTWDESRLIMQGVPFWGDGWEEQYFGTHRYNDDTESELDDSEPDKPAQHARSRRSSHAVPEESELGSAGRGRGAKANVNYGIGLPGGAPRLQLLVRKLGKVTSGVNIKQTLYLRGSRPSTVRMIVFHPTDPRIIYACSAFGLYKSYDGGENWVRTFLGTSPAGRETLHVAIDPRNPNRVLLGTGEGVYISQDGGENFIKSPDKGVGEGTMLWLYYSPADPKYVFAATTDGMLRSEDSGENWDYVYYTTFPAARVVRNVVLDPFDKQRGYIATADGMFTIKDLHKGDLESWDRLGGLSFTGMEIMRISVCPKHPGHMWVLTNMMLPTVIDPGLWPTGGAFVYESVDGGQTWKVIFNSIASGPLEWFENDPRDPDLLWIAANQSLHRMRRRAAAERSTRPLVLPDDPPANEVIQAALRFTGCEPGRQLDFRKRVLLKALVPQVDVSYREYHWHDLEAWHDGLYPTLPFREHDRPEHVYRDARFIVSWDLSDLVFNLDSVLFGRVDRINWELREIISWNSRRYYGELRRLRALMANEPPRDLRMRIFYQLRIEELTSYIDLMTGRYLTRWKQGGRPPGRDTKWWQPWVSAPR